MQNDNFSDKYRISSGKYHSKELFFSNTFLGKPTSSLPSQYPMTSIPVHVVYRSSALFGGYDLRDKLLVYESELGDARREPESSRTRPSRIDIQQTIV